MREFARIVIIGNHTQGLGIIRSAASDHIPVLVLNDKKVSLSRFSKYISAYITLPKGILSKLKDPLNQRYLLHELLKIRSKYKALLLGVNEDITQFIFQYSEKLKDRFEINGRNLDCIFDKYRFTEFLCHDQRIGTQLLSNCNIENLDAQKYLLKGRIGNEFRRFTGRKAIPLHELRAAEVTAIGEELGNEGVLVQRFIKTDRPILSHCLFAVNGQIRTYFQYGKLRQHPDLFGTGTYLKSIREEALDKPAGDLVRALNYTGIAEIEFVFDITDRCYKIIEMNPRAWKSIHFATRCGVNLIRSYWNYINGCDYSTDNTYRLDKYWVDLFTDIPQMIKEGKFRGYGGTFFECTWDINDPVPFFMLFFLAPLILLGI
jgi:predicted ATP-grasp superfamily ATP-dependent carboligase